MVCVNEVLPRLSWLMKDSFSSSSRLSSPGFRQSPNSYFGAKGLHSASALTPVALSCTVTSSSPSCVPTQASWDPWAEKPAAKGRAGQRGAPSWCLR